MATLTHTTSLVTTECWCGLAHAIPTSLMRMAQENGQSVYCPIGHQWVITETEAEKLRKRLEEEQRRRKAERDLRLAEERSHAATRGHLTRPCPASHDEAAGRQRRLPVLRPDVQAVGGAHEEQAPRLRRGGEPVIARLAIGFTIGFLLAFALARDAWAGNAPHPTLDAVASEVAGKPVSVWCETSWDDWVALGAGQYHGFTFMEQPVVFLSPRQCESLWALVFMEDVGTYYAASALLTLVHEAVHQRGVTDEGETDCTALAMLPDLAVRHFGVQQTVVQRYKAKEPRWMRVVRKVEGKRRTFRVKTIALVTRERVVPNPWLSRLAADAHRWHLSKPPEYAGNC